ncbi:MAG: hypothetical protein JW772_05525 [Candidatus Diapherotrites archaeon]|nr:hypothetical protein [Candidatus Diapherotrites archaeon]
MEKNYFGKILIGILITLTISTLGCLGVSDPEACQQLAEDFGIENNQVIVENCIEPNSPLMQGVADEQNAGVLPAYTTAVEITCTYIPPPWWAFLLGGTWEKHYTDIIQICDPADNYIGCKLWPDGKKATCIIQNELDNPDPGPGPGHPLPGNEM